MYLLINFVIIGILIESNCYFTTANMSSKIASYDDVVAATTDNKTYIVDVREPKELQDTGVIPNSINIPRKLMF